MKRNVMTGLLVLGVIVTITLTALLTLRLFYAKEGIIRTETIQMDFEVANLMGINADPDALHFGINAPGNNIQRWLVINNTYPHPVRITIRLTGEAGKHVIVDTDFTLEPGEGREITVMVSIPKDLPYGKYTGALHLTFRRTK